MVFDNIRTNGAVISPAIVNIGLNTIIIINEPIILIELLIRVDIEDDIVVLILSISLVNLLIISPFKLPSKYDVGNF